MKIEKPLQKIEYDSSLAVKGCLHAFNGEWLANDIWLVFDDRHVTQSGHVMPEARQVITDGDLLTVFNDEAKTDILWQGVIDYSGDKASCGAELHQGFDEQSWKEMFAGEYPAELLRSGQVTKLDIPDVEVAEQEPPANKHRALRKYMKRGRAS